MDKRVIPRATWQWEIPHHEWELFLVGGTWIISERNFQKQLSLFCKEISAICLSLIIKETLRKYENHYCIATFVNLFEWRQLKINLMAHGAHRFMMTHFPLLLMIPTLFTQFHWVHEWKQQATIGTNREHPTPRPGNCQHKDCCTWYSRHLALEWKEKLAKSLLICSWHLPWSIWGASQVCINMVESIGFILGDYSIPAHILVIYITDCNNACTLQSNLTSFEQYTHH